jgi:hypothetical protein
MNQALSKRFPKLLQTTEGKGKGGSLRKELELRWQSTERFADAPRLKLSTNEAFGSCREPPHRLTERNTEA